MSHYPQPPGGGDRPDPARLFIRRNRKKIFIAFGIGIVLVLAALVALSVFFFTVIVPVGTDIAKQAVQSDAAAGSANSFLNWIQQTLINNDLMQWITLLLQFNK